MLLPIDGEVDVAKDVNFGLGIGHWAPPGKGCEAWFTGVGLSWAPT